MVIRWAYTFQLRIHVDSTSSSTLRLIRWIFYVDSTSKSIFAAMVYFSTSILRRKVSVQTFYIFQRRFNVEISLHEDCRFINVDYKWIPGRCFPHGIRRFFDVEYVGDVEVPDDVLFTFLSTLHQRCKLKNKGEWIYQVN